MASGTVPLGDLTALVRGELDRVNRELVDDLRPAEADLDPLVAHAVSYRGKQLRPALVFLSGRCVGELADAHVEVAKVIELLHTATLVHDDVLDGARVRRKTATVNAMYGSEVPVLLGDYVYARAFHMAVQLDDPTCARVLSAVVRQICQGEITQILHRHDFAWDERRYFRVIHDKTAVLYGAACRLGGHYAGATGAPVDELQRFGDELGVAFQIVDDCLDLMGDEAVVGKSLGTDLGSGKLTLPMLWLLRDRASADRLRALVRSELTDGEKVAALRGEFDLAGAIDYAMAAARGRVGRAMESLQRVPASPAREAMAAIADYVLARQL